MVDTTDPSFSIVKRTGNDFVLIDNHIYSIPSSESTFDTIVKGRDVFLLNQERKKNRPKRSIVESKREPAVISTEFTKGPGEIESKKKELKVSLNKDEPVQTEYEILSKFVNLIDIDIM